MVQLHCSSRSMIFKRKIAEKTRAYIYLLRMEGGLSLRQISWRCHVSASSVLRICREGILAKDKGKNTIKKLKTSRPRIFTDRDRSRFLRKFLAMREENPNVTVLEVGRGEAGMTHVSCRTLLCALNEANYHRLTAIRKGVLSVEDRKKRVKFARDALKRYHTGLWSEKVLLYLDGVSFVYKSNPYREAASAQGKVYRRKNEGLRVTVKGTKNLAGGRRIHILVGISSGSGVVLVEEYTKMQGHYFAKYVQNTLHSKLLELAEMKGREQLIFVMDNDPCQASKVALDAVDECGLQFPSIPPRSPDINPIENVFHIIKLALKKEAMEQKMSKESFLQFKERVIKHLKNCDVFTIDRTLTLLPNRLKILSRNKGYRIK